MRKEKLDMSKHAFLIMAHNEMALLKKLVSLLDDIRCDIYIHIDAKLADFDCKIIEESVENSDIYFAERTAISWGGYSQILCELKLFDLAKKHGNYEYYHILSGVDFPIKSKDYFYDFFDKNRGKEFIHFAPERFNRENAHRYKYYHFFQEKMGRSNNIYRLLEKFSLHIQSNLVDRTKRFPELVYKGGTNWCSITDGLVQYILENVEKIECLFKYTLCCDEFFIQTLVYNSEFYKNVYNPAPQLSSEPCLRLIDWKRGNPYIFRLSDYDQIKQSKCLFVRKLSLRTDEDYNLVKLLENIDKNSTSNNKS